MLFRSQEPADAHALLAAVQRTMTTDVGVVRDAARLDLAAATLGDLALIEHHLQQRVPETYEVMNVGHVARALVAAAIVRKESRGSHTRSDFPEQRPEQLGRWVHTGAPGPHFVALPGVPTRGRRR